MEEAIKRQWSDILQHMKKEYMIMDVPFRTWIEPLELYSIEDNIVTICINDYNVGDSIDYISQRYGFKFQVAIEELTGYHVELHFVLKSSIDKQKQMESPSNHSINKSLQNKAITLDPRYTFDTFVVGSNNSLAHAASIAVAESPAKVYNPLFIYGGVGLGKTHLMHSIAHYVLENNPNMTVLYITSETFTNELIEAIRSNKDSSAVMKFKEKYRNVDVLLIDDIQFIIGKDSTQEEFFHTFNALHGSGKQIIISSDRPPKDFTTLEERLSSRFEWGLIVDIQMPDYETRMAILKKKEEIDGIKMDDEIIKYIATNISSNIRELEGAFTKIVALSRLQRREINLALAEEALKDIISPNNKIKITVEYIIDIVADHYNIEASDITSSKKSKDIAYPRQIAMYLCRKLTSISLKEVGQRLGNRDHTTVMHGCNKIEDDLKSGDETIKNTIDILIKKINPQ